MGSKDHTPKLTVDANNITSF